MKFQCLSDAARREDKRTTRSFSIGRTHFDDDDDDDNDDDDDDDDIINDPQRQQVRISLKPEKLFFHRSTNSVSFIIFATINHNIIVYNGAVQTQSQ